MYLSFTKVNWSAVKTDYYLDFYSQIIMRFSFSQTNNEITLNTRMLCSFAICESFLSSCCHNVTFNS